MSEECEVTYGRSEGTKRLMREPETVKKLKLERVGCVKGNYYGLRERRKCRNLKEVREHNGE